ncbi:MAG: hypothetical protein K2I90_06170 [Odoribacter sp.]|nr:hypothetical protein [Odoribacter sp.]
MGKLLLIWLVIGLSGYVQAENLDGSSGLLPWGQPDSVEIIDLLNDWNRQQLTAEEQKQWTEKIEGDIRQALFLYCLQDSVTGQPDFSEIHTLVGNSGIPVCAMIKHTLELTGFSQKKDLQGAMEAVGHIARADLSGATMQDWFVLGKGLNFILTEADLSQSKAMLRLLDDLLEKEERQEWLTLKKIRDNFEGKMMLIEMGEE